MSDFSGTIEVERHVFAEWESLYRIIHEFKEVHNLILLDLTIENNKVIYSFRSKYIHEDEVYYDFGDTIISFYVINGERVTKFEMRTTDEDKFLAIYRALKKIVKKYYKPYVE